MEGTLHLWDMRESNSQHMDRDSADLKVFTGIRKACFTTYDNINPSASGGNSSAQHSGSIIQIESIDTSGPNSASTTSQFITLDEAGFITIWLTSEDVSLGNNFRDNDPLSTTYKGSVVNEEEVGLSPQGMVKLVKRRVISPDCRIFYSYAEQGLHCAAGVLPVLAINPVDPSVLLVSVGKGMVYKGSRYDIY